MTRKSSKKNGESSAAQKDEAEKLRELEKWNNLKKSHAEKKILEHLLMSGPRKEEKDQPRTRLRNKKKNMMKAKTKEQKSTIKTNEPQKEYDIESIVKSIEGGSYKQPTKKNNKKKKRKRKGKGKTAATKKNNSASQEPAKKTEEERCYRKVAVSGGTQELTCKLKGLTIIGRTDRPGFRIPELNLQFECSSLEQAQQHVFLSTTDRQYIYGLPYAAENSSFISCAESQFDRLVSFVQSWRAIQGVTPTQNDDTGASPQEGEAADEANEPEAGEVEPEEEVDDGDELVWVEFSPESSLEYPEVGGYVHAYTSAENCLAYCFSKDEDPRQYSLVYTSVASAAFFRKNPFLLKADTFIVSCSLEEESEGQVSWKQFQPLVLANPDTNFILSFPTSTPSRVFTHFDSLIKSDTDLSNIVLFLPPVEANKDIAENQV